MNDTTPLPITPGLAEAKASFARLQQSARAKILFVTHNLGGGTERHVQDLTHLVADTCDVLMLKPATGGQVVLSWARPGESFAAYFGAKSEFAALTALLRDIGVARIHVHHIHGLPPSILDLAATLNVPLDVTLHDHFPITPRYHLDEGGAVPRQAGEHAWGLSLPAWRDRMHTFLRGAARIISPSRYVAGEVLKFFPDLSITVWPHPETALDVPPDWVKVLVPGRLSPTKGLKLVEACARDARTRNLPLLFRVIGPTTEPVPQFPELPLTVGGSYDDADLPALIDAERADCVWFPAQIPESYSYTLSAALASGLPIVATKLGAFIERLENVARARLLAWDSAAGEWNDVFLELAVKRPGKPPSWLPQPAVEYRAQYLAPIKSAQPSSAQVILKDTFFFPAKSAARQADLTLPELFSAGIDCGQAEARRELARRVGIAEQDIAEARRSAEAAHDALRQRDRDVEDLNLLRMQQVAQVERDLVATQEALAETQERIGRERDEARAAYLGIENSRFWRMTGPLRAIVHRAKQVRARLNDLRLGTRRLPHQIAVASQILKEEGPIALGKRVQEKLTRRDESPVTPAKQYEMEKAIAPLAVPQSDKPRFSIIVPVYGQHLLTYTCLKSIADTAAGEALEVIVIDDCFPDEPTHEALKDVTGVTFVRNETNLGFLRNCNKAAQLAHGEYVVMLNNDTIVTPGWLTEMARVFEEQENTGMVGVKLIYPDGKLQEAGGIVWRDGSAWNLGRDDNPDKPEYNYLREADYCSGACLMLKRSFWNELGGFDEAFVPAYYEDTDLAFRVRAAGKRVFYQPTAVVVHFEGRSSGTDLTQGVKKHQVINQETFVKRWREVLAGHRLNGISPHLERDRYNQRRVLVMDACMLTPDQDSGSLRMFEMLGIMQKMGCKVTFVADNLEYRQPYTRQIQQLGVEVLYYPFHSSITGLLERTASSYDVIILSRATVAVKYVDLVKAKAPRAKLVFDTVDLHFLRMERQAELDGDPKAVAAAAAMKAQELDIMEKSDVTLVVSPVEEALLDKLAPRSRIGVVSNIHVNMPGPKPFAERKGILFIGGFRHPPNLDAIMWYIENVLPIIRQKAPQLTTTIIGSSVPASLQKFAAPDFIIAGFVPDVTPFYHNARMSISPLRYGAGVKGKVNLSMQYGVPVVATPMSVEGMFLEDGVNVCVADSPEAFADAVIRVHQDEALWNRLSKGGLENIDTHFSRNRARQALAGVLDLD